MSCWMPSRSLGSVEALQTEWKTPAPQGLAAYLNLRFYNLMKNLPRRKVKSLCPPPVLNSAVNKVSAARRAMLTLIAAEYVP